MTQRLIATTFFILLDALLAGRGYRNHDSSRVATTVVALLHIVDLVEFLATI